MKYNWLHSLFNPLAYLWPNKFQMRPNTLVFSDPKPEYQQKCIHQCAFTVSKDALQ